MKQRIRVLAIVFCIFLFCLSIVSQTKESGYCDVLYPISDKNNTWGYINCKGAVVITPQFIGAYDFNDGVGVIYSDKGDGFVDITGKVTLFNGVKLLSSKFSEGVAIGNSKDSFGFFDKMGNINIKLPDAPLESFSFSEGLVQRLINGKFYFVDKQGQPAIEQGFDDIPLGFVGGVAIVLVNGKWAAINRDGEYVVKPQDKYISNFSDGLINISSQDENTWIYTDRTGKAALEVKYDYAGDFVEGLAKVEIKDKWGYIDKTGKIVITVKFDEVQEFSDGLAAVKFNNNLGFIDKGGRFVIPPLLDYIPVKTYFRHGLVYVYKGRTEGYINKTGKWIWKKERVN